MDRILLLEDDISLIDGLTYSLQKNDFNVSVVRTVGEAKHEIPKLNQYDLLLLDVTLPDGSGFEICEMVRATGCRIQAIVSFGQTFWSGTFPCQYFKCTVGWKRKLCG